MPLIQNVESSFRDPSGYVFNYDGIYYRQVNNLYKGNYDLLIHSGLYEDLINQQLLLSHEEIGIDICISSEAYKVIKPEQLEFISYPYEWCFTQIKDAALLTLKIQKLALNYGMSLKDASAYNIQFKDGKPVFIDTLSFEKYNEGQPWVAYRQFCQHFLAPLALMCYVDIRLNQLLRVYIDGIPLDLASILLPYKTRIKFSILSHIHLHAKSQQRHADNSAGISKEISKAKVSRTGLIGIIDSLESAVESLKWQASGTEWADYYNDTNYTSDAFNHKKEIVSEFINHTKPNTIWDLGANTGIFSRLASDKGIQTISFDIDPAAVENNYLECRKRDEKNILPLILDLTNPSPGIGWGNTERFSLIDRGPVDAVLALALIHHLAISNNVPFNKIAKFFSDITRWLLIEFVPKDDSQVQRMLSSRDDIFTNYTQADFENDFKKYFDIKKVVNLNGSKRVIYFMEKLT